MLGPSWEAFGFRNCILFRYFSLSFFGFIFGSIFWWFVCWFSFLRNLKIRAPVEAGAQFSQNSCFGICCHIWSKNDQLSGAKIDQKSKKTRKKTYLKTSSVLTSFILDFGFEFGLQIGIQKSGFFRCFFEVGPKRRPRGSKRPPRGSNSRPISKSNRMYVHTYVRLYVCYSMYVCRYLPANC